MDLTELMELMDELILRHAGGEYQRPANVVTAGIMAAEEAGKRGLVSGPLWQECGAHLLAAHFAYFRGIPIGTFSAPAIGQRFREIAEASGGPAPEAPPCQAGGFSPSGRHAEPA